MINLPKIIGHRGACGYAPENTLGSFKKAHELGSKWVEFDVKLSKDEELIVFHDDILNRTTNGRGRVKNHTYDQLCHFDAGGWFEAAFSGEKIPTFAQVLSYLTKYKMGANIEIKPNKGQEDITAEKTIEILQLEWPDQLLSTLLSSFSVKSLARVQALNPQIAKGLLINRWSNQWEKTMNNLGCISLHCDEQILTANRAASIKEKGYLLLAYTVNQWERALELWSWGVDSIFTDFPDRLMAGSNGKG